MEVEAFWTDLDPVLALRSIPLAPLVCLADINGRLGSVECASVGSHGATQETVTGAHFRKMCNKNRIFVPSTFPELHTGQTSTWLSPQDKLYRIDFGAFPIEWRTHQFESFVDTELDVVHNRRDHFPLVTRCSIVSTFEQTVIVRKKPIVSRDAIKDPVAVADFKYNMNQIPFCHWTSHSHDHHYNTFKLLQNAASATFPLVVNVPNKSWIGPRTWALMLERRQVRTSIQHNISEVNRIFKSVVFSVWRDIPIDINVFAAAENICNQFDAVMDKELSCLRVSISKSKKLDFNEHLVEVSVRAAAAHTAKDSKKLNACRRELCPKPRQRPQMVKLENGSLTSTPLDARKRWQSYFCEKMCGEVTSFEQMLSDNTDTQCAAFVNLASKHTTIDLDDLPTLMQTVRLLFTSPTGKGHGEDALCGELFKAAVFEIAELLWPLFLKTLVRVQEPLQWKGGICSELVKSVLDCSLCSNHHDILVSDNAGKRLHTWSRGRLMNNSKSTAMSTQHCGQPHMGTDLCSHFSRSFWGQLSARGISGASLFVDVSGAFASVLRQLLIGGNISDELLAFILKSVNMGPEVMEEFRMHLASGSFLIASGVSDHLNAVVKDAHSDTWFTTQGLEAPAATALGARAGDPLADIFYNYLVVYVHNDIEKQVSEAGIAITLPPLPDDLRFLDPPAVADHPVKLIDNVYADDGNFYVANPDPIVLCDSLRLLMNIIVNTYLSYALNINFGPGKTEAMLALRGRMAQSILTRILLKFGSTIPLDHSILDDPALGGRRLRIVRIYKHMGTVSDSCTKMNDESKRRSAAMYEEYRPTRSRVYANKGVQSEARISLAESLLHSRLLFNCGTWPRLTAASIASMRTAYIAPYRAITCTENRRDNSRH